MFKLLFVAILILLGFACIGIHASTIWMDENGVVHEPFLFLVLGGYLSLAIGLLGVGVLCVQGLRRRFS